jgi:hypothetical protein
VLVGISRAGKPCGALAVPASLASPTFAVVANPPVACDGPRFARPGKHPLALGRRRNVNDVRDRVRTIALGIAETSSSFVRAGDVVHSMRSSDHARASRVLGVEELFEGRRCATHLVDDFLSPDEVFDAPLVSPVDRR